MRIVGLEEHFVVPDVPVVVDRGLGPEAADHGQGAEQPEYSR